MRFEVEYHLPSGQRGLHIFSVDDTKKARDYVKMLRIQYGYEQIINLKSIPENAGVEELYRLFPASK
jgi:hypothetical protein